MSEFMDRARVEAERNVARRREALWKSEGETLSHSWGMGFERGFSEGVAWASEQEPTDQERIALVDSLDWAIRGTTDGDRIDLDTEIPVGEVMRLIEEGASAALAAAQKVRAGL